MVVYLKRSNIIPLDGTPTTQEAETASSFGHGSYSQVSCTPVILVDRRRAEDFPHQISGSDLFGGVDKQPRVTGRRIKARPAPLS